MNFDLGHCTCFHSKDSWWTKEGDSSDYGRDFIVRILCGLKRERKTCGLKRDRGRD